ncbi:unnamed protein product [Cunninghamella blakesleeana]
MKFATLSVIAFGTVSCYAGSIGRTVGSQCNIGPIQCCNQLQGYHELDPDLYRTVSNLLGGNIEKTLHGQFGIDCTAVSVMGAAGVQCNAQAACCEGVEQNSLIGINCSPLNLNG